VGGYSSVLSAAGNDRVQFMVNAPSDVSIRTVRFTDGVGRDNDVSATPTPTAADGTYTARPQAIEPGSYFELTEWPSLPLEFGFTLHCWVWSTTPSLGRNQGLISSLDSVSRSGLALLVGENGHLTVLLLDGGEAIRLSIRRAVVAREWYLVAARYDSELGRLRLSQHPASFWLSPDHASADVRIEPRAVPAPLHFARLDQSAAARGLFNGKLASPAVWNRVLGDRELDALLRGTSPAHLDPSGLVGAWDFCRDVATKTIRDASSNGLDGAVVNWPARGVTGPFWTGEETDFRSAPEQWSAIHFHDDDLEDARWEPLLELSVPPDLRSGVYGLELSVEDDLDWVPFVVRPQLGKPTADIAVLWPTLTYLAYANTRLDQEHLVNTLRAVSGRDVDPGPHEAYVQAHPELGPSLYNLHSDGSPCYYASRLRPLVEMRPTYSFWMNGLPRHFSADLYLLGWLERRGSGYDVVTDEDLDADGFERLRSYRTLIMASHPEYWTAGMLDALRSYLTAGGTVMYLGGNGLYWVTSRAVAAPHIMEVRRGHAGTRCADTLPGELHHSTTGEAGGIWRHRGRPPQALVGVGMSAMGGVDGAGYARCAASYSGEASFAFRGVTNDVVGINGAYPGAAADELDRADDALGSPPGAEVLATSRGAAQRALPGCGRGRARATAEPGRAERSARSSGHRVRARAWRGVGVLRRVHRLVARFELSLSRC
jgi:N,N-dimethylformamidase beta subunit-like protein